MSRRFASVSPPRRGGPLASQRAVLACVGVMLAALFASAPPAGAQVVPGPCPAPVPVSELEAATIGGGTVPARGLTVSRGIEPEAFTAEVLGVLEGGIAPGVDMIIAEATSPAIDRVAGIWAGMSGSPVYTEDGRLVGAVSYGLASGPSKIAGITPATDMLGVLAYGRPPRARAAARVRLPRALRAKLAARADISARQAASVLAQLPLPLAVSGLGTSRLDGFANRISGLGHVIAFRAAADPGDPGDPSQIKPGGNIAAALSYGDITAAGLGTTTAVCDGVALALGHPMVFRGAVRASAHTARAITVQDDPTFFPYKLGNLTGIVGTVDQDRLPAIRVRLGAPPVAIPVTSTVVDPDVRRTRDGVTNVNSGPDLPGIAAAHLIANIDRAIDRIGGGRSLVRWTLDGIAAGTPFSLSRENRFAAAPGPAADIALASSQELDQQLTAILDNQIADVTFGSLRIDASVADQYRAYRVHRLERRTGATWTPVNPSVPFRVSAGQALQLRAHLTAYRRRTPDRTVELTVAIPSALEPGTAGMLEVRGGGAAQPEAPEGPGTPAEAETFDQLLTSLRDAPRNDEVIAELLLGEQPTPAARARERVDEVVTGSVLIPVEGPPEPAPPARR